MHRKFNQKKCVARKRWLFPVCHVTNGLPTWHLRSHNRSHHSEWMWCTNISKTKRRLKKWSTFLSLLQTLAQWSMPLQDFFLNFIFDILVRFYASTIHTKVRFCLVAHFLVNKNVDYTGCTIFLRNFCRNTAYYLVKRKFKPSTLDGRVSNGTTAPYNWKY